MKVYERRAGSPYKWIFAGVLFLLAMTFTMTEVYGFNYPYQTSHGSGGSTQVEPAHNSNHVDQATYCAPDDNPGEVPEPTTLLLLASGLGLVALRKNRQLESK